MYKSTALGELVGGTAWSRVCLGTMTRHESGRVHRTRVIRSAVQKGLDFILKITEFLQEFKRWLIESEKSL